MVQDGDILFLYKKNKKKTITIRKRLRILVSKQVKKRKKKGVCMQYGCEYRKKNWYCIY